MTKQTIKTEEKWVRVESPSWVAGGQGACWRVEGEIYFDVKYENETQVEELLNEAKEIYNNENYAKRWISKPEAKIYWKETEKYVKYL